MNRCAFSPWPHISSDTRLDAWVCEAYQAQISQLCAALLQTVCVRSWQASRTVGDVGCRPGSPGNTASREPIRLRHRAAHPDSAKSLTQDRSGVLPTLPELLGRAYLELHRPIAAARRGALSSID